MEKEIHQLEEACLILARAIEDGKISGIVEEVQELLGYVKS